MSQHGLSLGYSESGFALYLYEREETKLVLHLEFEKGSPIELARMPVKEPDVFIKANFLSYDEGECVPLLMQIDHENIVGLDLRRIETLQGPQWYKLYLLYTHEDYDCEIVLGTLSGDILFARGWVEHFNDAVGKGFVSRPDFRPALNPDPSPTP